MVVISDEILSALKHAVAVAGNATRLAKLAGIRQTTIRNWICCISHTISDANWQKIKPFLSLPPVPVEVRLAAIEKRLDAIETCLKRLAAIIVDFNNIGANDK